MIDTTSINYALSKISEGWQNAAPAIQGVGEKYVRFVVTQQVISAIAWAIALGIYSLIFLKLKKQAKKWTEEDSMNPAYPLVLLIGGMGLLALMGLTIDTTYDVAVAVLNPEMYTVQSVIDAARSK